MHIFAITLPNVDRCSHFFTVRLSSKFLVHVLIKDSHVVSFL